MGRDLGPKCRLCRREGVKLFLKGERCLSPKCPLERKGAIAPGMHKFRMKKMSGYGIQLREKQKIKRSYLILEKQLKNYYHEALRQKGDTGEILLGLLERRLDNLVYRSGLAASRVQARQLVTHGHLQVDGKRVKRPAYRLAKDQVVSFGPAALKLKIVKEAVGRKAATPAWIKRQAHAAKIVRLPVREDISAEFNDQLIVEFYSR